MLRGKFPRSPVWLRKIPSTVSGSQGSRRGLRPAVRFAFPLGARLDTTLRARPCQELFSESFFPAVPRAAGRPALRASALRGGEFGIIRAPGAARAGNPPAHRMPTTPARRSGRDGGRFGREGGIGLALRPAPQPRRFAPAHRRGRFSFLYISKEIGTRLRAGGLPRRRHASGASPCRRLSPARFRQASRGGDSLPKEERPPPDPPAFRAGNPLGDRPRSILYVGGFPSFRY